MESNLKPIALVTALTFLLLSLQPLPLYAGEFRVFGPKTYVRDTSSPDTLVDAFQVLNPNTDYTLRLTNGNLEDTTVEKVSSSVISLNGSRLVGPENFNQNVSSLEIPLHLSESNTLSVELRSRPGGTLVGEIVGIDEGAPTVQILSPADGSTLETDTVEFQIALSDDISGLNPSTFHVTVDGMDKTSSFSSPTATLSSSVSGILTLDAGRHTLHASINDQVGNAGQAAVTFTVSLGPPVTPSSGFIHGQVFDASTDLPLEGASVSAEGIVGTLQTGPDGKFSFPTPGSGGFILDISKEGYTPAHRKAQVVTERSTAVDPAFLTPLDPQVTPIGPSGGVARNSAGTLEVEIPAGALSEEIPVRATRFQEPEQLPNFLPDTSIFTYAADFQPHNFSFEQPVTVRVLNTLGFAPGTPIPIGFWNEETFQWEDEGMGVVDITGTWAEFQIHHFSAFDFNLAMMGLDIQRSPESALFTDPEKLTPLEKVRGCPAFVQASEVSLRDGALLVDIPHPSFRILTKSETPTFVYNSSTVKPKILLATETFIDETHVLVPESSDFKVSVEGVMTKATYTGADQRTTQRYLWDGRDGDGALLPTGTYAYEIELTNNYPTTFAVTDRFGGAPLENTGVPSPEPRVLSSFLTGHAVVHNEIQSHFGAGWTLQGLQRLHVSPNGSILLTDGDSALGLEEGDFGLVGTPSGLFKVVNGVVGESTPSGPLGGDAIALEGGLKVLLGAADGLKVVDSLSGEILKTIPTPGFNRLALSPDETKVYGLTAFSEIQVIDLATGGVDHRLAPAVDDFELARDGSRLYYATSTGVEVVDAQNLSPIASIPITHSSMVIGLSPDGTKLYAAHRPIFLSTHLIVSVIDTTTHTVTGEFSFKITEGASAFPTDLVFSPDGKKAYLLVGGFQATFGGFLAILDAVNDRLSTEVGLGVLLSRIRITLDGKRAYITHAGDSLTIFDLMSEKIEGRVHMGPAGAFSIAVVSSPLPDGTHLYAGAPGSYLIRRPDGSYLRKMKDGTQVFFDAQGLQRKTVDRNGNETLYQYIDADGDGNADELSQVTYPLGQQVTLHYGAGGHLESMRDPTGRTSSFTVDSNGDLVAMTLPDGTVWHFAYQDHLMVEKENPRGGLSQYVYDPVGSVVQVTFPDTSVRTLSSSIAKEIINTLPAGEGTPDHPTPFVRPEDVAETVTDARGFTTTTRTDPFGEILEATDPLGRVTQIVRDRSGLPTLVTQPSGGFTELSYDAFGNLLSSAGFTLSQFTYEPKFHQVTRIQEGRETPFTTQSTTTIDYDERGNPTRIRGGVTFNPTTALTTTEMTYDARGLLTSVTSAKDKPEETTTTFTYDPVTGNLLTTTDPLNRTTTLGYDAAGNVTSSRDPKGNSTTFEYDAENHLTAVIDPSGGRTEYTYDANGNLVSLTDAASHATLFEYDALNRLTKTTNPLGQFKTFSYDPNGNLSALLTPNSALIQFTYDAANQLIQKTLPGDTVTYGYDLGGNLILAQDGDSKLRFTYDAYSHLIEAKTGDALNPALVQPETTIHYTYDIKENRDSMTDPQGGVTTYGYDRLNRLLFFTPPVTQRVDFNYDALSRRIQLSRFSPQGAFFTFSNYNTASELLSLQHRIGFFIPITDFAYTYDLNGNRLTKTQDALTSNYTYDSLNRLNSATSPSESYNYDAIGNRNPLTHVYNTANRLLDDGTFTYTYDANGNMTSKTEKANPANVTTYTYDPENQLIQVTSDTQQATYHYDALGRRVQKNVNGTLTRYIYDNEDILQEYDGTNTLRARWTHGPGIDEPLIMERDLDLNGSLETQLFYLQDGLGSTTALLDTTFTPIQSYQYDSFGNITSQTGTLTNPYTFTGREYDPESGLYYYRARYYDPRIGRFLGEDPFSAETIKSGLLRLQGPVVPNISNNRILPTQQTEFFIPASRQTSVNLLYLFSEPQHLNRYLYTRNNPINYIDAQGNLIDPVTAALVFLIAVEIGLANFIFQSLTPRKEKPLDYTPDDPSDDYEDADPPNPRLGGSPRRGPTVCPPAGLAR